MPEAVPTLAAAQPPLMIWERWLRGVLGYRQAKVETWSAGSIHRLLLIAEHASINQASS